MAGMTQPLTIHRWDEVYENSKSRSVKALSWVRMPTSMNSEGYTLMAAEPDGAALYGAWVTMVSIAAGCKPRGSLMRSNGKAHDSESLGRATRLGADTYVRAIAFFSSIGWLLGAQGHHEDTTRAPRGHDTALSCPKRRGEERRGEERRGEEKRTPLPPKGGNAPAKPKRVREPDPIWDKVCEKFGMKTDTRSEKSRVGKAVRDLKAKNATPEAIDLICARYRETFKDAVLTPEALTKHWDQLEANTLKSESNGPVSRVRDASRTYDD